MVGVVAGGLLAACGGTARAGAPPNPTVSSTTATGGPAITPPTTMAPTPTTTMPATTAPTMTAPPATTTTVVADATTADPKVLAQQLQAVLDRYESLVMRSRSNPELPFTDSELISELQTVATTDFRLL